MDFEELIFCHFTGQGGIDGLFHIHVHLVLLENVFANYREVQNLSPTLYMYIEGYFSKDR